MPFDFRHALHQHQNVAVGIGVNGARAQRLLRQRDGVEIGVVVARRHAHGRRYGRRRRRPANIRRTSSGASASAAGGAAGGVAAARPAAAGQTCSSTAELARRARRRRGDRRDFLFGRRRRARDLGMLDVEPLVALRRLAAGAARAIRIAERQPHLEGEIGAQEVDEVGAVGAKADRHVVFAETQIVEQEIARSVAQHFMPRLPGQLRVERRVEQLRDPRRIQVLGRAIPAVAHLPEAARRRVRRRRLSRADDDVARDVPHSAGASVERQRRVPRPRGRRGDLGEPGIGRPAVPLVRFGRDASIGRDQRKLALERLFRGDEDAQRRALPRRHRRRQDRDIGRIFAGAGCRLGHCVPRREAKSRREQERRRRSCKPVCTSHGTITFLDRRGTGFGRGPDRLN